MPLCFVLMPWGAKTGTDGRRIDFDEVYERLVQPAIVAADMEPLRAEYEEADGFKQRRMFEAMLLCEYAVVDLSWAHAKVFYEVGIRHAARPWTTVPMMAEGVGPPIDLDALRTVFYKIGAEGGPDPAAMQATAEVITGMLREARTGGRKDRPLYELIDAVPQPQLDHEKADVFRGQIAYSPGMKDRLAEARAQGGGAVAALKRIEEELGEIGGAEAGVLIDLMLSYRSRREFAAMIALIEKMAPPLRRSVMVQEQYALALNRSKQPERAERVLLKLLEQRGPSSETYSILGRVYKDQWDAAQSAGDDLRVRGLLERAAAAYLKGFEADWRDAFPGVNAITLMELREPPDPRRLDLVPVVRYAVERRMAQGKADYWDYATLLELAVVGGDQGRAEDALTDALAHVREIFEPDTTARNLGLLVRAKAARGELQPWMEAVVARLRESC